MKRSVSRSEQGASLVETMVGVAIGLLVTLVIYQLYTSFEGQKRTTTSGGNAQTNGMFAMSAIERDVRMAGWGLVSDAVAGCATIDQYDSARQAPGTTPLFNSFMPVQIIDGGNGAGASDQLIVRYGTSIGALSAAMVMRVNSSSAELQISTTGGFNEGDVIVLVNGSHCNISQVTNVQPGPNMIQRNPGGNGVFNPPGGYRQTYWTAEEEGTEVFNLGALSAKSYAISGTSLQLAESGVAGSTEIAGNIVALKAAYGLADPGGQNVVKWVRAINDTTADPVNWSNPGVANAKRIKAVRLSIVARSPLMEKPDPSGTCSITTTAPTAWTGEGTGLRPVDLTHLTNWGCYRYRTFQTIIPLRNAIWAAS